MLGLTAGGIHNFPHIHKQYNINNKQPHKNKQYKQEQFKFEMTRAPVIFQEQLNDITKTWTHPKLVINYVRVYATDPYEK